MIWYLELGDAETCFGWWLPAAEIPTKDAAALARYSGTCLVWVTTYIDSACVWICTQAEAGFARTACRAAGSAASRRPARLPPSAARQRLPDSVSNPIQDCSRYNDIQPSSVKESRQRADTSAAMGMVELLGLLLMVLMEERSNLSYEM